MTFLNKSFVCPYCNLPVKPSELIAVCFDPDCGNFFSGAYGAFKNEAVCPQCHHQTAMKACPRCKEEIPANYAADDKLVITVVGSKESGKTHYIAALINALNFGFSRKYGISIIPANESIIKKYTYGLYDKVYREKSKLAATVSAAGGVEGGSETAYPFIYTMNFRKGGKKNKSISLVIYDTAGEDLKSTDDIKRSKVVDHIINSDGIIYIFDPLQVDFIREHFEKEDLPVNVDNDFVVPETLLSIFQSERTKTKKIPFAFTVSKFDQIKELINSNSKYFEGTKSGHSTGDGIVLSEFEEIDGILTDFFSDDLGSGVEKKADSEIVKFEHHFDDMCKFTVSALGGKIGKDGKIEGNAKSYRVEDPFLWILYKNKIIKPNK